jgi:hypothetical protein
MKYFYDRIYFIFFLNIRVLVVLLSYFIIGTLYNRFVNQTRGIEQFPNWRFWHSLGIKFQVRYFKKLF